MYKKPKMKVIAIIMSVLLVLWISTLSIIYVTTYKEVKTENKEMMELYARAYSINGSPTTNNTFPSFEHGKISSQRLKVTTFYSVAFKEDGNEITNDGPFLFTDEELVRIAEKIKDGSSKFGMKGHLVYLVSEEVDYTLVVIMDNTMVGETLTLIVQYMLLFGGIAVLVLLGISIILSNWIFRPLEQNDRKQKQFISDAGHELKTPISTINANLELLERELGQNRWLDNITYENDRMATIVNQLLDLAKIQDVKVELSDINLSRLIMAGVLPFEAKAYEMGVELRYEIAEKIMVKGNAPQIQMLLSTLLDNALSHSIKGGVIHVTLREQHNKSCLVVSNQGPEIPMEERERIFDRFYRSDVARNSGDNHYGLGLAIAKSIVQTHQGSIYVTCKDGWTEFNVVL